MHQYIPLPKKSGYDNAEKEFLAFESLTKKDMRMIENSVFNMTLENIALNRIAPSWPIIETTAFVAATNSGYQQEAFTSILQGPAGPQTTTSSQTTVLSFSNPDHQIAYELLEMRKRVVSILDTYFPE